MKLHTALQLGRVSNLPTVWTNVLVGLSLAPGVLSPWAESVPLVAGLIAVSLLYLAGMFLNDAFDAEWDNIHGQDRPIVRGEVAVGEVVAFSLAFIVVALVLVAFCAAGGQRAIALVCACALVAAIVSYDALHKRWPHSAWIMGSCRMLVYLTAASLVASPGSLVLLAGVSLTAYIAGITYLARAEHLNHVHSLWPLALLLMPTVFALYAIVIHPLNGWALVTCGVALAWVLFGIRCLLPGQQRQIPRAIGTLLAGLCLIDASLLMIVGHPLAGGLAVLCFAACLVLQKTISAS